MMISVAFERLPEMPGTVTFLEQDLSPRRASAPGREAASTLRRPLLFPEGVRVRTIVYVDGFNLYYGALRDLPYRWLDLQRLCRLVMPRHDIVAIRYYTALVNDRAGNPGQSMRQRLYLRALATLPSVTIHLGLFRSHVVRMRLAYPVPGEAQSVRVIKTEEKGSDVNLATHLVRDAYERAFDAAVVISGDSDLVAPIELAHRHLGLNVGVLSPSRRPSLQLAAAARYTKSLRPQALANSQFPPTLRDHTGTFHRPPGW
jgi:uncharacterized LabA/DUF88 family protein